MMPETWLPTCTVVTAEMLPVAVTLIVTSPRLAASVRYFGACSFPLRPTKYQTTPPRTTTPARIHNPLFIIAPVVRRRARRRCSMDHGLRIRQRPSGGRRHSLQGLQPRPVGRGVDARR